MQGRFADTQFLEQHVLVEFRIRIVFIDGLNHILQELLVVRGVLQGLEIQAFGCLG